MIFFELYKQLDIRMYRTVSSMEPSINPCTRYMLDGDRLITFGTNVSVAWNLRNKEVCDDNPYRHFDLEDETLYWFSSSSAASTAVHAAQ